MARRSRTFLGALALALAVTLTPTAKADRNYTVRAGDTLARIARRFHTSVRSLRRANRLRSDSLRVGARIRIPVGGSAREARRRGEHLVRSGDSLNRIARRYRVSVRALRRVNGLRSDRIRAGQRLIIPGRRRENRAPRVAERPLRPSQAGAAARAEALELGSVATAHAILGDGVEARWREAAEGAPLAVPEDARALDSHPPAERTPPGTMLHPLVGEARHFMRGWGSGAGGYHLAVDLYAPPGSPIRAAERGIVAYAGSGLGGYGRFVIVVHPNGRATAYAHNREVLVRAGELVAQGQVVSLLGNTGLSRGPHLHFMLIHEGKHCDPSPLLRPLPQRRNGQEQAAPVTWPDTQSDASEQVGAQNDAPNAEEPSGDEAAGSADDDTPVRCLPRSARPHPGAQRRRRRR
ncbi:MAG: LysM peptidoglycan-binding domain-containing protein [Myxococcota bacterium]